jgi:peroxiredoxin
MKKIICFIILSLLIIHQSKGQNTIYNSKVVVVFSPYCPICLKNIYAIKDMYETYSTKDSIEFQLLLPTSLHVSAHELTKFKKKYKIPFSIIIDVDNRFINQYNATVTPEAYLIDDKQQIKYQGLINNRFVQIGLSNNGAIISYLEDAIKAYIHKEEIKINKTSAIGCFIEKTE